MSTLPPESVLENLNWRYATTLGVDACPMEGFNPAAFDEILGLRAEGYAASVIAASGYRAADDVFASFKKVRLPTSVTLRRI